MWQQSHGRWPFLMRRKVCLTNYPGGQTTCLFWSRIFMSALSLKLFFSRLLSICGEPWHLTPIFAFKLALPITTYWLSAITYCLFSLFFIFFELFQILIMSWTHGQTAVHLDHRSDRRVMHQELFDMKSMICKVDQINHQSAGITDGYSSDQWWGERIKYPRSWVNIKPSHGKNG